MGVVGTGLQQQAFGGLLYDVKRLLLLSDDAIRLVVTTFGEQGPGFDDERHTSVSLVLYVDDGVTGVDGITLMCGCGKMRDKTIRGDRCSPSHPRHRGGDVRHHRRRYRHDRNG